MWTERTDDKLLTKSLQGDFHCSSFRKLLICINWARRSTPSPLYNLFTGGKDCEHMQQKNPKLKHQK